MRRLHIFGSATACLSLIATILIAAPAHAGSAQRNTAPQEQEDQRIRADTGRGVQPVAWDQGLSPGPSALPLHEIAKKYDGVDVMDGNAPGTAAVQTQPPWGAVRITVPGKRSETRPAQLKGVPIGHFIGEGAPLLTTALSGATTTTYSTPHGSQTLITVESDKALRDYRFPLALAAGSTAKVEADGSVPWPVLALTGAELQVLAGLSAAVFVGGTWVGCTFSKLTGWIATVVNLICRVSGASGAISAIGIISGAFRGASLVATKCYGINLSKPSAPLRDMPGRDCGF